MKSWGEREQSWNSSICLGNSSATISQTLSKGRSAKLSFKPGFYFLLLPSRALCNCSWAVWVPNSVQAICGKWREITAQLLLQSLQMFNYCLTHGSTIDFLPFLGVWEHLKVGTLHTLSPELHCWMKAEYLICTCELVFIPALHSMFKSFKCWNPSARYASLAHQLSLESNLASFHFSCVKNTWSSSCSCSHKMSVWSNNTSSHTIIQKCSIPQVLSSLSVSCTQHLSVQELL